MIFRLKDKGQLGYIRNRKLARGIVVAIGLAAIIAIFLTGYIATKTRNNLLSLVAILTALPVSKYIVLFIMLCPYHSETKEMYDKVVNTAGDKAQVLTEMILTTREKIMPIDYLVVKDSHVYGYTTYKKCDIAFTEKFLVNNMQLNGHKVAVKIWDDEKKFLGKVSSLASKEIEDAQLNSDIAVAETLVTLVV